MESTTATAQAEVAAPGAARLAWVRSVAVWVAGLAAAGVALRFATLGLQSYHHDEVVTAARVLPGSFGHMLHEVRISESTPPLYYVLAWVWSKCFGLGEAGLRSLSALFGAATIPVAYLIGKELSSRRAGVIAAALVAFNPMLVWYSQEARAYALLILLCAVSLLFFLRFRRSGGGRDLALWSVSSALALVSHYFAVFPLAIESVWLLATPGGRRRPVMLGIGAIAATGLALAPLLRYQASLHHTDWIARFSVLDRLWDTAIAFQIGETGKLIGEHQHDGLALLPGLLILSAFAALLVRRHDVRPAAPALIVGAGAVILALGAAAGGQDFVLSRNLLPALVPLLAAAAVAMAGLRRTGALLAGALCVYWLAFVVHVDRTPELQRPDWRAVAGDIGPATTRRAIVTWALGAAPLDYYLDDGTHKIHGGEPIRARELDVISDAGTTPAPQPPTPAFTRLGADTEGGLTVTRYVAPRRLGLSYRRLRRIDLGFDANFVMFGKPSAAGPIPSTPGPAAARTAMPGHGSSLPLHGRAAAARSRTRGCAGRNSRSGTPGSARESGRRGRSRSPAHARRRAARSIHGSRSPRPRAGRAPLGGRAREGARGRAAPGSGPRRRLHSGGCRRRGSALSRKRRAASRREDRH